MAPGDSFAGTTPNTLYALVNQTWERRLTDFASCLIIIAFAGVRRFFMRFNAVYSHLAVFVIMLRCLSLLFCFLLRYGFLGPVPAKLP